MPSFWKRFGIISMVSLQWNSFRATWVKLNSSDLFPVSNRNLLRIAGWRCSDGSLVKDGRSLYLSMVNHSAWRSLYDRPPFCMLPSLHPSWVTQKSGYVSSRNFRPIDYSPKLNWLGDPPLSTGIWRKNLSKDAATIANHILISQYCAATHH